jgi:hypothetical protein
MSKGYYDMLFPRKWDGWEPGKYEDKWYKKARQDLKAKIEAEAERVAKEPPADDLTICALDKVNFGTRWGS